ncbi:MAG: hypothetical protein H7836_15965, partial [Magnetococcus sp. YQC-3]
HVIPPSTHFAKLSGVQCITHHCHTGEVRFALQEISLSAVDVTFAELWSRVNDYRHFVPRFNEITRRYLPNTPASTASLVAQLPDPEEHPDLVQFFKEEEESIASKPTHANAYHGFELILQKLGV